MFADRDLYRVADVAPVATYPQSLPADLTEIVTDGWLFVGAMENHLPILKSLRVCPRFGTACGPSAEAISRLRDPVWLRNRLEPLGCYPDVVVAPESTADVFNFPSRWLQKPLAGGGGRGVGEPTADSTQEPVFWQRRIDGIPWSALFLATNEACEFLMVSRQLIGREDVAAPTPFTYCGSIGPCPISAPLRERLAGIAQTLLAGLDYRGLLGIDFILEREHPWVIEINPRYTASCELWEFATGRSVVGEHVRACCEVGSPLLRSLPSGMAGRRSHALMLGKLVLFADQQAIAPDLSRFLGTRDLWSVPWIADIPAVDSVIPAGAPICTVYASASSIAECQRKLSRRAERVRNWFRSAGPAIAGDSSAGI